MSQRRRTRFICHPLSHTTPAEWLDAVIDTLGDRTAGQPRTSPAARRFESERQRLDRILEHHEPRDRRLAATAQAGQDLATGDVARFVAATPYLRSQYLENAADRARGRDARGEGSDATRLIANVYDATIAGRDGARLSNLSLNIHAPTAAEITADHLKATRDGRPPAPPPSFAEVQRRAAKDAASAVLHRAEATAAAREAYGLSANAATPAAEPSNGREEARAPADPGTPTGPARQATRDALATAEADGTAGRVPPGAGARQAARQARALAEDGRQAGRTL